MPNNFAFIDSQNVHLGIATLGWKLDWRRFRVYLQEHYGVSRAYLFIGYVPENQGLSPNRKGCSALLKRAARQKIDFLEDARRKLEYKAEGAPPQDRT